jgi:hypothetical protein
MAISGEETDAVYRAGTKREVVGVFADQDHFQRAIDDLQANGVNRANISTVANAKTLERELGHGYINVRDIEDDSEIPRAISISKRSLGIAEGVMIGGAIYVPTVIVAANLVAKGVSYGMLIGAVAAVGAVGGLVGWLFARRLDRGYRRTIGDQLEHGGIVLWVSVHAPEQEARVVEVLARSGAHDLHVHDLPIMVKPMPGWRGPSHSLSFMRFLGM